MSPLEIVNQQAEDEGLWFEAQTAPEAYLQQELRRLHAAVEGWPGAEEVERLRAALAEIAKGEGRFSRDPYEHACNTIESMKTLAADALTAWSQP